jgi:hypothetical protein
MDEAERGNFFHGFGIKLVLIFFRLELSLNRLGNASRSPTMRTRNGRLDFLEDGEKMKQINDYGRKLLDIMKPLPMYAYGAEQAI